MLFVDWVVLVIFRTPVPITPATFVTPSTLRLPPMYAPNATPNPPAVFNEPVVLLELAVSFVILVWPFITVAASVVNPDAVILLAERVVNDVAPSTPNVPVAVILATVVAPDTVKLLPNVDAPVVLIVVNDADVGFASPILPSMFAFIVPTAPVKTPS